MMYLTLLACLLVAPPAEPLREHRFRVVNIALDAEGNAYAVLKPEEPVVVFIRENGYLNKWYPGDKVKCSVRERTEEVIFPTINPERKESQRYIILDCQDDIRLRLADVCFSGRCE